MLSRDALNALLPEGVAWVPIAEDDYDLLFEGIADNTESVKIDLDELRYLRDPAKTTILSDLEKDYSVIPVSGSTVSDRRDRLASTMFIKNRLPTYEFLEAKLNEAGFDVFVHENSPAADPAIFLDQSFQMTAGDLLPGGNAAECGEAEAYCGRIGGELVVNGEQFEQLPNYTIQCGEALSQCGEAEALAGQYDSITLIPILYEIPTESGYWPLIFFVGGPATRDGSGTLIEIEIADIPIERRLDFRRIILRYKPMFSWGGLVVVYK